ncbi:MAG: SDR family NAD(P)-dependent oxidoreductase [Woeseiaceae bacterium]|nr:SDR family NAD(P)-dependent oxidoreductase [Woeseiaceae bacterium]
MDRRQFLRLTGTLLATHVAAACAGTEKVPTAGVPRSAFGADATAEEVTRDVDLSGKLALVTGCTSGIGFETMRVLALRGAWVIGTSRSLERAEAACTAVRGRTTPLALELGDFDSVVACADAVRSINQPLDILLLNAGYFGGSGEPELIGGLEKHFVVNHLGHFVLANRLMGRLYMADQGRVVAVSSRAAYKRAPADGIQFDNLDGHRDYDDFAFYGHSKLANALFALHLAELLKGTRITANALHPGVINTEIDRHLNRFMQAGFAIATGLGYGKSVEEGAATSCYVATSPALGATSGRFFEDCNAVTISGSHLHDHAMAARLWEVSEALTNDYLVTHTGPDWNDFERALRERRNR